MKHDPIYLRYVASYEYGIWMIRLGRNFYRIKAPWNQPLYSERNRIKMRVFPLGFGWRFQIMKVKP